MKTRLLTILIFAVPFLSKAQLPDMDFETWNTVTLYDEPDGFSTSNISSYLLSTQPNVTEVSGSQGSAARLETVGTPDDTVPGLLTNRGLFAFGFSGGEPYTGQPDSIRVTVRGNHMANDSSSFLFLFKFMGVPIGLQQFNIGGNITNFTSFSVPTNLGPLPPDSVVFLINSGETPGSWIEIDAIEMVNANQQVNNSGLDNWSPVDYTDPQGWTSSNLLSILFDAPTSVRQNTTDVVSGSSSLEIENTVINIFGGFGDTVGYISNSNIFLGGGGAGSAYTSKPEKLSFHYKYTPMGNDSATVGVLFTKWNSSTQESDSITGNIMRLGASSSFTKAEIQFDWTGNPDPDSVLIAMAAGDLERQIAIPGSIVIFDNLMLEFGVGIATPVPAFADQVHLYPNPAGDEIFINLSRTELEEGYIRILNILGQPVFERSFSNTSEPIRADLSNWQSGTYLYEITSGDQTLTGKFIVH